MPVIHELELRDEEVTLVFERDLAEALTPRAEPKPRKDEPRPSTSRELPFAYD